MRGGNGRMAKGSLPPASLNHPSLTMHDTAGRHELSPPELSRKVCMFIYCEYYDDCDYDYDYDDHVCFPNESAADQKLTIFVMKHVFDNFRPHGSRMEHLHKTTSGVH